MSIIAKYKFDKSIYADLLPEFNAEFTSDKYNTTDEEVDGIITRTIESDELPTLMRFGRLWVDGESATDNRTDSLLEILDMNTSGLTSMHSMFRYCKNLISISCEWDTSKVTDMYSMFTNCINLTSLDVSNFNTSKVTSMGGTFYGCNNLTSLDVSNFNTSNVINMGHVFSNCNNLTSLDVSNFDTSSVTYMNNMFELCLSLTSLDVSNFDTSNVINMSYMFYGCNKLTSLDVSNFNTSKVTDMNNMFDCCFSLTEIHGISNWDTSNVTNMVATFGKCESLIELNLSGWDISSVTNADNLFGQCFSLVTLDISNFKFSTNCIITNIFNENLGNIPLADIGMLYCNQSTIETIASLLPTNITQTIWIEDVDVKDLTPVEGVEFKQYAKNTEVMLTSPLLEGDKLIVKDGKLYHYHKMGMVIFDGSEDWYLSDDEKSDTATFSLDESVDKTPFTDSMERCSNCISNNFKSILDASNIECFVLTNISNRIHIAINRSKLVSEDVNGFKQWLQVNPTTVVYELANPYYELISEDPLDISLISETVDITNSSNIPLNMTINNKGLSTVAMSPSTTYTVAFDKDEDSEVVVNLCGNEVTTTDNIVEITTPSEIDDELIFYGDGVEVSNVRLLEGSVSGDSVPRESFEGLKNSFEDGYIPSENLWNINELLKADVGEATTITNNSIKINNPASWTKVGLKLYNTLNKTYTLAVKIEGNPRVYYRTAHELNATGEAIIVEDNINKFYLKKIQFNTDNSLICFEGVSNNVVNYNDIVILEGDWTHLTEEDFNNLGKYKVEYKVTGKNKFNGNYSLGTLDVNGNIVSFEGRGVTDFIDIKPNTSYIGVPSLYRALTYDKNKNVIQDNENPSGTPVVTSGDAKYMRFAFPISDIDNIQLEEGTTATEYEPYKSYTKTFYLNSPLLEGDTIEDVNGVATHVKRYDKVVLDGSEDEKYVMYRDNDVCKSVVINHYPIIPKEATGICNNFLENSNNVYSGLGDGIWTNSTTGRLYVSISKQRLGSLTFKQWFQQNPTTAVYKLASPIYEPISTESILCDSYVNGHLDVDTNIPIEKVEFDWSVIPLKYISSSTNYLLQFDADNDGILNWMQSTYTNVLLNTNIVKGKNKLRFTTPNASTQLNELWIGGIGFNASNIQVVATDRNVDFGYFKGLQSSFEEKTAENLFDESCLSTWWLVTATNIDKTDTSGKYFSIITKAEEGKKYTIKYDYMNRYIYAFLDENYEILKGSSEISMFTTFQAPKNTKYLMCYISSNGIKEEDYDNIQVVENSENFGYEVKCKVVGKNKLADKYKVEGYLAGGYGDNVTKVNLYKGSNAVSYIIPCKPNTEYILSNGNGDRDALAFSSDYPRHDEILNSTTNGRITTNNNAKWLMVYVNSSWVDTDLNCQLEEGIQATPYEPYQEYTKTIYLNSPLLKGDTIEVHNGKLCHYHKMGKVVLDGSENWVIMSSGTNNQKSYISNFTNTHDKKKVYSDKFNNFNSYLDDVEGFYLDENLIISINKSKISTEDISGVKQWLSKNPTTVVYELAEPYYEEITPIQEDLIITSVKEGDLHIDTIIPISSKVTYNVNVQLLTNFEQSIVEQVQATQTTDLQSILDEEIDN